MEQFGVPTLRLVLVKSNQKSGIFISPVEVLYKRYVRGRYWEAEETVDHKGYWGNHIRNLTFTCDSAAVI